MIELSAARKNKINLSDYPYQKDIENRLLMADFSVFDVEVLEEILFSPLKIPITKLARTLETPLPTLMPVLQKLGQTGLFTLQEDILTVDKEMRKYFESQLQKFDKDFKPDMESLQALLRKVPIHILPIWYSIPRTSNNIFESIVEKYLLTPQIFQRYLMELSFDDPAFSGIIQDVFNAPDFLVLGDEIKNKYHLTPEQFEEYILHLEFNFICCLSYMKVEGEWKEIVTPFHEWKEYLSFLRDTKPPSIKSNIQPKRSKNYSFIEDMAFLIKKGKKLPIEWVNGFSPKIGEKIASELGESVSAKEMASYLDYWKRVAEKLCQIKLAAIHDGLFIPNDSADDWLEMTPENKAVFLYRHPLNRLSSISFPPDLLTEKNLREAEKSIKSVSNLGWVYFDDFIDGSIVILSEEAKVVLKKVGKSWKYNLPQYTDGERAFIKAVVFEWLFEAGMVTIGEADGKDAFCVTPFGHSIFGA